MYAVELNNVTKIYNKGRPNEVVAVNNATFKIKKGTNAAIIGVSGSGKTTLLNLIGCVDSPTNGSLTLFGQNVTELNDTERANLRGDTIGFALQQFGLLPNDTVYSNLRMPLFYSNKFKRKMWRNRISEMAKILQIDGLLKEKIRNLSGGQKQRVSIGRALINDPSLILADEPTSALDSKTAAEVMALLADLCTNGKTVVVVTHDTRLISNYDQIITIVDGKIK